MSDENVARTLQTILEVLSWQRTLLKRFLSQQRILLEFFPLNEECYWILTIEIYGYPALLLPGVTICMKLLPAVKTSLV